MCQRALQTDRQLLRKSAPLKLIAARNTLRYVPQDMTQPACTAPAATDSPTLGGAGEREASPAKNEWTVPGSEVTSKMLTPSTRYTR